MTRHLWLECLQNWSVARAMGSPDGINDYLSLSNASLQVGGYRSYFNLKRDGIRQAYLCKTRYKTINPYQSFKQDMRMEPVRLPAAQRPYDHNWLLVS